GGPAVSTASLEGDAEASCAERAMDDSVVAGAVQCDARRRRGVEPRKEMLHAAQVADAFLTDGGGEDDRTMRSHARAVDRFGEGEHRRESTRVVDDARAGE